MGSGPTLLGDTKFTTVGSGPRPEELKTVEVWSLEVPDEDSGTGSGETIVVGSGEKTAVGLGPSSGLTVDSDIGPEREEEERDTMTQP